MIPEQYGRAGVLLLFAILFPALPLVLSHLLYRLRIRPERPDPVKGSAYECGVEAEGSSWGRFNARYYLFAIGFVIFDVEVIFLYPWAAAHAELALHSLAVLWKAALFVGVLAFGLAYAWRRGALEWR